MSQCFPNASHSTPIIHSKDLSGKIGANTLVIKSIIMASVIDKDARECLTTYYSCSDKGKVKAVLVDRYLCLAALGRSDYHSGVVVAVLLRHVQWERNLIERNEALLPPRDPPMMVDDYAHFN